MFASLKPSTTLTAFVLLCISISSLQVVTAAPRPTPIALFDPEVIQLEARHDCQNETSDATPSSLDFKKQNGLDAQKLNAMFQTLNATDACQDGQMACINSQFAQCTSSKWALTTCASGTSCFALPLVNKPGTSLACDVPSDANARFEAAGVQGGPEGSGTDNNGDENCDDEDPAASSANGSPDDDGDCDDDDSSTTAVPNAQPTSSGDSIVLTTVTTTVTLPAAPTESNANNLNVARRQLTTLSSPLPSDPQPSLSSSTPSLSPPSPSSISSSSTVSVATPTVVVGTNGIVTVTVVSVSVSTVTVAASDCNPSSSPSVAGFIPTNSPASSPGPTPSTLVSSFSFSSNGPLSPSQAPNLSSPVISLQAIDPTPTPTPTPFGGLSFSTQVLSTPVPDSSPTQDANISQLLTATLGS